MKKIIMYTCIISLTFGAGTDVLAAPTLNEVVSGALNATIEKAKSENSGFELTGSTVLTNQATKVEQPTGSTANTIIYSLSNMRAQAELYYSTYNGYGSQTQSCAAGIFADKTYGLGNLMADVKKNSKEINCTGSSQAYAVSAKVGTSMYWCIDSAGDSLLLSRILKKGSTKCSLGSKPKAKLVKDVTSLTSTLQAFPTNSGFDLKFIFTAQDYGVSETITRILKQGSQYLLITKSLDTSYGLKTKGLYVGRYMSYATGSFFDFYFGLKTDTNQYITKLVNAASVQFVRTNSDSSSVYTVSIPYSVYLEVAQKFSRQDVFGPIHGSQVTMPINFNVVIKNGIITSISSSASMKSGATGTLNHSIKSKVITGGLHEPQTGKVVSCLEYFGNDAGEVCSAYNDRTEIGNIAPEKGISAAIKSYLSNMRAQAELYYSNNNSYGPNARSCSEGIFGSKEVGGLSSLVSYVKEKSPNYMYCASDANAWVVSAAVPTGGYYCVDSTGVAKDTTTRNENGDYACR